MSERKRQRTISKIELRPEIELPPEIKEGEYKWQCILGGLIPSKKLGLLIPSGTSASSSSSSTELKFSPCRKIPAKSRYLSRRGKIYDTERQCLADCKSEQLPDVLSTLIMGHLTPQDVASVSSLSLPTLPSLSSLGETKEPIISTSTTIPSIWAVRRDYQNRIQNLVLEIIKETKESESEAAVRIKPLVDELTGLIVSSKTQAADIMSIWENLISLLKRDPAEIDRLIMALITRGWKMPSFMVNNFWRTLGERYGTGISKTIAGEIISDDPYIKAKELANLFAIRNIAGSPFLRENIFRIVALPSGRSLIYLLANYEDASNYTNKHIINTLMILILNNVKTFPIEELSAEVEKGLKKASASSPEFALYWLRFVEFIVYNISNITSLTSKDKLIIAKLEKEIENKMKEIYNYEEI